MRKARVFFMAGGGTGGHVIPSIAVAQELRRRGHEAVFVGTRRGLEARLAPAAGFPIEWVEIGALKRVGIARTVRTLLQLPLSVWTAWRLIGRRRPAAVFSMGGYAAGPVVMAARLRGVPIVVMEPNAVPGMTNRRMGRYVAKALLSFPEAARYFPLDRTEVTGLPVRGEFFEIQPKPREEKLTVLISGGSRGSRTLNNASRESWPLFREAGFPLRLIHQAGRDSASELAGPFAASGVEGEVVPFIDDMPGAFRQADLVVSRAGAGAVAEVAAAGRPSILVPFPYAADNHQLRNAEALARAGAAKVVRDEAMNGECLFREVRELASEPEQLVRMGEAARAFAKPGAAQRTAEVLEELAENR